MDGRKILVIIGITGNQGGSVGRTFLHDPSLRSTYRLRGISRDASSGPSQELTAQGVEMISANLHDPPSLLKAFEGAHAIFSVTDFWKPYMDPNNQIKAQKQGKHIGQLSYDLEYEQGRNIADAAAKTAGLERFIVSMTCSTSKCSGGRFSHIFHFDAKAAMITYVKSTHPDLAAKMSELNMGVFFRAWKFAPIAAPRQMDDGTHHLTLPCNPNTPIPFVDPANDTGPFVRALLTKLDPGVQLYGESSLMSWNEWLALWGRVKGKEVVFEKIGVEDLEAELSKTFPQGFGTELGEMYEFMGTYGYSGGEPACRTRRELGIEIPGLSSVEEYIRSEDWSLVGA
ncbi:MAG: hypothetical protein Q9190_000974 [Brigantiaea leucoxantha]